jgi:hypothetical protein
MAAIALGIELVYYHVTCNKFGTNFVAAPTHKIEPSATRVRAHRARLRRSGLKPVQFWVPDVRGRRFLLEARKQVRAVARSAKAHDDQAFVDAISVWGDL